jgi:Arylsulfotransferase (ASST)
VSRSSVAVSARPGLFPAFSPSVSDYVTRCRGFRGVRLFVSTSGGAKLEFLGRARSGRYQTVARVSPGREFVFRAGPAGQLRPYHVRCLPPKFPHWSFRRYRHSPSHLSLLAPGLAIGKPTKPYMAIFDEHGVPIWWYARDPAVVDAELLPNGTIAFAKFEGGTFGDDPAASYEIRTLTGRLVRRVRTVGSPTDDHELQVMRNGNYVLLSYVPRAGVDLSSLGGPSNATVLDAEIQIVRPNGSLVWRWSTKDHVALSESSSWGAPLGPFSLPDGRAAYDIVHGNSVQIVGKTVVLSLRHTSAVYGIDRTSGRILWKLGGTTTPESLAVAGNPGGKLFSGQHFARLQANGTLTVHDNGTNAGRPPRALRFRIDTKARTARLVEAVTDPTVKASLCCGSATRFADGRWLVSWGGQSVVGEYAPGGAPLWRLTFGASLFSYRAIPIPVKAISKARLRAAMNVINPRR